MDEENQNQTEQQDAQIQQQGELEKFAAQQGKNMGRNVANQGLKLIKQAGAHLAKLIAGFIMAHIVPIIIIVAIIVGGIVLSAIEDFIDADNAETIDEVTYQMIKEYCTIDEDGIHFDKEGFLKNITVELAKNGIDLDSLNLGEDKYSLADSDTVLGNNIDKDSEAAQYLYKFVTASLAGEFPYIPGSDPETQGIIKIKRKTNSDKDASGNEKPGKDLEYMGYEEFKEKIANANTDDEKDDMMNYFSLDEKWNLCIVKSFKRTENHYSHGTLTSTNSQYTISEVKIPYRTMVSQYTVPFLFLIDLQMVTHNATYVEAVAELMTKQSEIEFTIFDEITHDTYEYTYKATRHKKSIPENAPAGWEVAAGIADPVGFEYSESEVDDKTEIITITDKIKANVTKANTWIIKQETKYEMQETIEYPYTENGTTKNSSQSEPGGAGSWDDPIEEHWYEKIVKHEWVKSETNTKILPDKFMGLWSNETGTYVKGATYLPVGEGKPGKVVKYNVRGTSQVDRPIINIVTAQEELYGYLENSVTTQIHAELMRELIKMYEDGKELEADTFEASAFTSMYEPEEFVEGSYVGDFDVHDESLFITDLEQLKKAFEGGYSTNEKLLANVQAFLDMQEKYKVNAIFAAAVSITETTAGTRGNGSNGRHNWFNMTGTDGPYETTQDKYGNKYNWRVYANDAEGIEAFGIFISGAGATKRYYPEGNYTVGTIGPIYCPNSRDYPTQAEDWVSTTLSQMARFYEAIGIDITPMITGGGFEAAGGEGYRGIYTTADGKSYVEYLQDKGPWATNKFCDGTVSSCGCSITSVATIVSGFGIDVNPGDLSSKYPNSTNIPDLFRSYGLTVTKDTNATEEEVLAHLQSGNPILVYTNPPDGKQNCWTSRQHFFPVLDVRGDEGYVANPVSSGKTGWNKISTILLDNESVLYISK